MNVLDGVSGVLIQILGPVADFTDPKTALFGAVPELDSMAVVNVITGIEEYFDIYFEDDEVTAEMFESVGSLCDAVRRKMREG